MNTYLHQQSLIIKLLHQHLWSHPKRHCILKVYGDLCFISSFHCIFPYTNSIQFLSLIPREGFDQSKLLTTIFFHILFMCVGTCCRFRSRKYMYTHMILKKSSNFALLGTNQSFDLSLTFFSEIYRIERFKSLPSRSKVKAGYETPRIV